MKGFRGFEFGRGFAPLLSQFPLPMALAQLFYHLFRGGGPDLIYHFGLCALLLALFYYLSGLAGQLGPIFALALCGEMGGREDAAQFGDRTPRL